MNRAVHFNPIDVGALSELSNCPNLGEFVENLGEFVENLGEFVENW